MNTNYGGNFGGNFGGNYPGHYDFVLDYDYEIQRFTKDLTEEAARGELDRVVGRDEELNRMIRVLCRRRKNNPVITGEPGVGKTALVEGLAQKIVDKEVPKQLLNSKILTVDLGAIIAGTRYRGEFEERLQILIQYVQKEPSTILFIDEIHTIIGAGSAEGTMDAANILKPVLSRGKLRCIGATTASEYKKHIERDAALERRFQPISIEPPSQIVTTKILCKLRPVFEDYHGVVIANDALIKAVELSNRYIPSRHLPDKAIDVIDEACALVRMKALNYAPGIAEFYKKLDRMEEDKIEFVRMGQYQKAVELASAQEKLKFATDFYKAAYHSSNMRRKAFFDDPKNREFLNEIIPAMGDDEEVEKIKQKLTSNDFEWVKSKLETLAKVENAELSSNEDNKELQNSQLHKFIMPD